MVNLTEYAYVGNYNAVYLDEIKRSDGSGEAQQFGELLKRVRYGKFDQYAYVVNYDAVYLDEIKRSDGSCTWKHNAVYLNEINLENY